MTCFQCGVDNTSYGKVSKTLWVQYLNDDLPGIDSLCKAIGATTSNYTMVVVNGAMQTGASSALLALGVVVASLL